MVPEPLPLRQALRSPPFTSGRCRPWSHSVLTRVSPRYPQQGGRLLRRYSPFRHSDSQIIANKEALVRLACLIHAASVRSEPESNSHSRNFADPGSPGPTYSGLSGTSPNPSHPFQIGRSSLHVFLIQRTTASRRIGLAFPCKSVLSRISNPFGRVNNFFLFF